MSAGLDPSASDAPHTPVMLDEVLAALGPIDGATVVDATFGAGGYTRALLAAGAIVHAFDRDPDALAEGALLVEQAGGRLTLHHAPFSRLAAVLGEAGIERVTGVVFDIGVSSMQLDRAERGFLVWGGRAARHADGPGGAECGRPGQHAGRGRAGRRAVSPRRRARVAPHRARHRGRAPARPDGRAGRAGAPRAARATGTSRAIRRPGRSRRCGSR